MLSPEDISKMSRDEIILALAKIGITPKPKTPAATLRKQLLAKTIPAAKNEIVEKQYTRNLTANVNKDIRSEIPKMLLNVDEKMPFRIRAIAFYNTDNQTKVRYEKYSHVIRNSFDLKAYSEKVFNNLFTYNMLTAGILPIRFGFQIQDLEGTRRLYRVAENKLENCVIMVLRAYTNIDSVYREFPELTPKSEPIYIDDDCMKKLANYSRVRIEAYTELGAMIGKPWFSVGSKGRKKIPMLIRCEHASLLGTKLKVSSDIEYEPNMTIPYESIKLVSYDYEMEADGTRGSELYYTTVENGNLVMHKRFRPSTITKNPEDDTKYPFVFDSSQLLYKLFKQTYGLRNSTGLIKDVVKLAEHFIGKKRIGEILGGYTEIDHNGNYAAYETTPYYCGFPYNLTPVTHENSKSPAFVIVESMNKYPESLAHFYNYDGGAIVITYPVYKYLIDNGVIINVDYILDGAFNQISITQFMDQYNLLPGARKAFRNQLIGRTITGGIAETKSLKFYYKNEAERDQLLFESHEAGFLAADNGDHVLVAVKKETGGLFDFHSYILGYACIHMLDKWKQVVDSGMSVIAYNVDALVVNGPWKESSDKIGGWKTGPVKPYYHLLGSTIDVDKVEIPRLPLPNRPVIVRDTIILGAAGIGKSYPWKSDPFYNQCILTPTKALRDEHLVMYKDCFTAHKYFQFGLSYEEWDRLRKGGKIPCYYQYIIIDELTRFTKDQWDIIRARRGNSVIIALGDFLQIRNSIGSTPVTPEYFHDFDVINIVRQPETIARQNFEFGTILDKIFRTSEANMEDYFKVASVNRSEINVLTDKIIVGNHVRANYFHKMFSGSDNLFPVVEKRTGNCKFMKANSADIFWDRVEMNSVSDLKYEPYLAVTSDCFQGKTFSDGKMYIDCKSLVRQGCLYTAMTRCKTMDQIVLIEDLT